jgi:integrase
MAGRPVDPEDYVIQNSRGGRVARQRIAEMIREAARLATETRLDQGLPPLPRTTPHSLRRTYISIALLANNFDVKWVMNQVGHADSKMTLDVYAQLEQRVKREHGVRSTRSSGVLSTRCTARRLIRAMTMSRSGAADWS